MANLKDRLDVSFKTIVISAKHLPKEEYDRLDIFMDYNYGGSRVHSAIYNNGVIIYYETDSFDNVYKKDFPALFNVLSKVSYYEIAYVDFFERGVELDDLTLYEW